MRRFETKVCLNSIKFSRWNELGKKSWANQRLGKEKIKSESENWGDQVMSESSPSLSNVQFKIVVEFPNPPSYNYLQIVNRLGRIPDKI